MEPFEKVASEMAAFDSQAPRTGDVRPPPTTRAQYVKLLTVAVGLLRQPSRPTETEALRVMR